MMRYNPTKRRMELTNIFGEVVGAYPPESVTPEEEAAGTQELVLSPQAQAAFDRYLQGDTSAAAEVGQYVRGANAEIARGVQEPQQKPGGKVGILQTPEYLNANLNIAEVALDAADAFDKLSLRERDIIDRAQKAGLKHVTADYIKSLYAGGAGGSGPFPATEIDLNQLQAADPRYINFFARLGSLTNAAELNRRQNVLAAIAQETEKAGGAQTLNERVRLIGRERRQAERRYTSARAAAKTAREVQEVDDEYKAFLSDLQEDEDALIEKERPGYIQWKLDQEQAQFDALPEHIKAGMGFGAGSTRRFTPGSGMVLPVSGQQFINPAQIGSEKIPTPVSAPQPPPAPKPTEQQRGPALPGYQWVQKPDGSWVQERIPEMPSERQPTPTYQTGGPVDTGAFGGAQVSAGPAGADAGGISDYDVRYRRQLDQPHPEVQAGAQSSLADIEADKRQKLDAIQQELTLAQQEANQAIGDIYRKQQYEVGQYDKSKNDFVTAEQAVIAEGRRAVADIDQDYREAVGRLQAQIASLGSQQRGMVAQNPYTSGRLSQLAIPGVGYRESAAGLPGAQIQPGSGSAGTIMGGEWASRIAALGAYPGGYQQPLRLPQLENVGGFLPGGYSR